MRLSFRRLAVIFAAGALLAGQAYAQTATNIGGNSRLFGGGEPGVPIHPDQRTELALKVSQPFTVAAVGDLLEFQPFGRSNDPNVQYLLNIIRHADVAVGDFENEIYDFDNFGHYGVNLATKEVADDWAQMGIDMVSRANNKDQRSPGVWENLREVERVGIIHAGVAHSLPEARMARYFSTPKGLVGFVGVYAEGGIDACCEGGAIVYVTGEQLSQMRAIKTSILARRPEVETQTPGGPTDPPNEVKVFGVTFRLGPKPAGEQPAATSRRRGYGPPGPDDGVMNTLKVKLFHGVTAEQMAQLRAIAGVTGSGDLRAFGTQFRVMARPGEHSFDMDPQDRHEILTQIRTGKQASDIMVTNVHWHQNRYDFQAYSYDHFPADFEIKFAHDAIDQGDDVFVAEGVHTLKGIEIYKGKPIFYGVSNFIFQSALMPLGKGVPPGPSGERPKAAISASPVVTDGPIVGEHEQQGFWQLKSNLEAILVVSRFEKARLVEVLIYPVDLGQTARPSSQVGIPRRPGPEIARKILDEVIEYSKPFGTRITVENGVGHIRLGLQR